MGAVITDFFSSYWHLMLLFAGMMIDSFIEEQSGEVDAHDVSVGSVILNNKSLSDE